MFHNTHFQFFTQFQLQQVQLQQLQREQQEQLARKMEQNFYDNFPPLSAVTGKGKEQVVSRKGSLLINKKKYLLVFLASKNTTVTGSMPLIHSNSASNLHFHNLMAAQPNNVSIKENYLLVVLYLCLSKFK